MSKVAKTNKIDINRRKKCRKSGQKTRNRHSVMYFNARSIRNKIPELKAYVALEDPDIVCITESWLDMEKRDDKRQVSLPGYSIFHKDRIGRQGGGVLIYIKSCYSVLQDDKIIEGKGIEALCLELNRRKGKKFRIGLVYRPPDQTRELDNELNCFVKDIVSDSDCVILGDFNFPEIRWDDGIGMGGNAEFLDTIEDNFLTQLVEDPTRGNNILDLVFVSDRNLIDNLAVGENIGESDHNIIRFDLITNSKKKENSTLMPNFNLANFDQIRSKLRLVNWEHEFVDADTNEKWVRLRDHLKHLTTEHVPKKKIRSVNKSQPKWYNGEIGSKITEKKLAARLLKHNDSEENLQEYRIKRDSVKREIRKKKRETEIEIANNCRNNPKDFFRYFAGKTTCKSNVGPLVDDSGRPTDDDKDISEILNRYFSSVFTEENMENLPTPHRFAKEDHPFINNIEIDIEIVKKKLKMLKPNKSPGPDEIHSKILRECYSELAEPLSIIFKSSLESGVIPSDWKIANVTPIFKKGDKKHASNYRPISLTSICCKVLESIIRDQLTDYLDKNSQILDSQHGFRNHRSCLTNLLEFFDGLTDATDKDYPVDILYLDFSKAFDTVPHARLMLKLEAHGIANKAQVWIKNWLSNRKQRVVINGTKSVWADVTSGVPQGSVLGPLLFLIYINDIDLGITSRLSKFADDTKIGRKIESVQDMIEFQKDIDRLVAWGDKWQMKFNINKCKQMHIGRHNLEFGYEMDGKWITKTDQEKDLGVVVDNKLKPSQQCIQARNKANKILSYISKSIEYKSKDVITKCYNSLVRPHLEYCVQFWSPYLKQDILLLEKIQKRATKMIPQLSHLTYEERLKELDMFTLRSRRIRGDMIQVFKMFKGIDNLDPFSFFECSTNRTRGHSLKIKKFQANHDLRKNYFTNRVVNYWNSLPAHVIECNSLDTFKKHLDSHMRRNSEVFHLFDFRD